MRESLVSIESQLSPLLPHGAERISTSTHLPWAGFLVEKFFMHPGERLTGVNRWHVISALGSRPATFEETNKRGNSFTYTKAPGALTFFPIGEVPAVRLHSSSELMSCAISEDIVAGVRSEGGERLPDDLQYRSGVRDDAAERIVGLLTIEMESGGPSGRLYAESLIRALICRYFALASVDDKRILPDLGTMHPRLLKQLREWMGENAHRDISLDAMAKQAKYSPTHLLRVFRASTGLTPYQYLIELRIEKAQNLLRKKDNRLIDVAAECGFSSQAHLTTAFKARRGVTPGEYRRQCSF